MEVIGDLLIINMLLDVLKEVSAHTLDDEEIVIRWSVVINFWYIACRPPNGYLQWL